MNYVCFDSESGIFLAYGKTYLQALDKAGDKADTASCLPVYRVSIRQDPQDPSKKRCKLKRVPKAPRLDFLSQDLGFWSVQL